MLYTKPPSIERGAGSPYDGKDPVVVPVGRLKDSKIWLPDGAPQELESLVKELVDKEVFTLDQGTAYVTVYSGKPIALAGLGEASSDGNFGLEAVRRGFAQAVKTLRDKYEACSLDLRGLNPRRAYEAVIASGLAAYRLEEFKNTRKRKLGKILVYGGSDVSLDEASAVLEGVYLARDIANAPPHHLTPARLADLVSKLFSGLDGVSVEVLGYDRLRAEGFGGIVSVGMGSDEKPVLIIIKYEGGNRGRYAVVGKTVIFDSGGINLKPSQGITYMRADKAGGAATIGLLWTAAKLKLPATIYGLVPAVINVPSGSSYLPSDVIRMWDGTMVEITNTDAEGRLILADAIAYAAKRLGADVIVDLATLTGAIVVALGPLIAGLFTRHDDLARAIEEASGDVGEKVWRMPMEDEYAKTMSRSAQVGEIVNAAQRYGGAIFGALFLERFSHGKKHVHLDIAGPGISYEAGPLAPPYWPDNGLAPGYGVRLMLETLKRLMEG